MRSTLGRDWPSVRANSGADPNGPISQAQLGRAQPLRVSGAARSRPGRPAGGRRGTAPARPARRSAWPAGRRRRSRPRRSPGARSSTGKPQPAQRQPGGEPRRPSRAPAASPAARSRGCQPGAAAADVLVVDEELARVLTSSSVSGLLTGLHQRRSCGPRRRAPGTARAALAWRTCSPCPAQRRDQRRRPRRPAAAPGPPGARRGPGWSSPSHSVGASGPDVEQQVGERRAFRRA